MLKFLKRQWDESVDAFRAIQQSLSMTAVVFFDRQPPKLLMNAAIVLCVVVMTLFIFVAGAGAAVLAALWG